MFYYVQAASAAFCFVLWCVLQCCLRLVAVLLLWFEALSVMPSWMLCWHIISWFLIHPYLLRYAVLFRYGLSPHNAVVLVLAIILKSVMIDFRMLGQKWLLICCGLSQQMVGTCRFVSYRAGGRIHSTLLRICLWFRILCNCWIDMGLWGLERVVNACCCFCRELMVRDSISCWRSIYLPNFRPALKC